MRNTYLVCYDISNDFRLRKVHKTILPARMLNEFVYCPRLFFYEWVEGVFAHSADTVEGSLRHEKLGEKVDAMATPGADGAERIHARSVTLTSDTHGLIATIDLVEGEGGRVSPVDYKHGAPRQVDGALETWPADRVQVCVQALILRENGYRCDEAVVYYNATKQRVRLPIDEPLVTETLDALNRERAIASAGVIPPPLVDSPKCPRCSLVSICLPDETRAAMAWRAPEIETGAQLVLFESSDPESAPAGVDEEVRRLVPARDDLRPLYVTGYNFVVGKSNDVLQVREKGELVQEVRIREISQVARFYTRAANTWASVTPVILPGHDDHKPTKTRKLIEKALAQSGIENSCEFEWSAFSQFPKSLSSHKYDRGKRPTGYIRPSHLLSQTAVHLKLRLNDGLTLCPTK